MLTLIAQVATATDPLTLIITAAAGLLLGGTGAKGWQIVVSRKRDSRAEAPPPVPEVTPFVSEAKFEETIKGVGTQLSATNSKVDHMGGVLEGVAKTTDRIMDHLLKN